MNLTELLHERNRLQDRYQRTSERRQNLSGLSRQLDANAREIADHPALALCRCGCTRDMHVGEIGCPCGLPDESPCAGPVVWCDECDGWVTNDDNHEAALDRGDQP